jgi:hypothetical protein
VGRLLQRVVLLSLLILTPVSNAPAGEGASTLARVAEQELAQLAAHDGTPRSMDQLLERNIQDYFSLYQTPSDPEEFGRLMRTAESVVMDFLVELYAAAAERTSDSIRAADVKAVVDARLPFSTLETGDRRYFPAVAGEWRLEVEHYDLEALRDTGLPWRLLLTFSGRPQAEGGPGGPLEDDAVGALADGLVAYSLVLFRLAGANAHENYAPHLGSRHIRQAVKMVADRAAGQVQPPVNEAPPAPAGTVPFVDVTEAAGIHFRHRTSDWLARFRRYGGRYPTFSGGGVTAGDVDADGWPDLIFCGGDGCAIYANQQDGTFKDVTEAAGIHFPGEARMSLLVDLDNDGRRDLFLTYARDGCRLYRGLGEGRFEDITAGSGIERKGEIAGPAVAVDYDNDGLLDLFVANFGNYLEKASPWMTKNAQNGLPSRLYHNEGGHKFRDVTEELGIEETGWSQAVSHVDYDVDGDQDIYVANDFGRNALLHNNGDGTLDSRGRETFTDNPFHGMNVAFTDLNQDEHPDIFITNIWTLNPARGTLIEFNTLLMSRAVEGDIRYRAGHVAELNNPDTGWSWGAQFLDYDNDGDDDLKVVNGLTHYYTFFQERAHPTRPNQTYPKNYDRIPNTFYRNDGGKLVNIRPHGAELGDANARSAAHLDYDRDGDLDLVVTTFHSRAHLFRNDGAPEENHWLKVKLVGDPARGVSRDAIGTRVIARTADGLYIWRSIQSAEGYMAMNTLPLEFGLGAATEVDLEILWPGLQRQELRGVAADRFLRIHQGRDQVEVLDWSPVP